MSTVLNELSRSEDPIDREVAHSLRVYQDVKESLNLGRHLGREPASIQRNGSVEVVERRVREGSGGFEMVPAEHSYEAIVLKYPHRFSEDVVAIASERLRREESVLEPTADPLALDQKVRQLLDRAYLPFPEGAVAPQRTAASSSVFLRDPRVKAFVLRRSGGCCELCATPAPFKTSLGLDYLEVHHMKALANGGSDRVQNAVALCPNCHRAMHHAANAAELTNQAYNRNTHLVPE